MKTPDFINAGLPAILLIFFILSGCNKTVVEGIDPIAFQNPPDSVRIYAWWHWMDNAITKEGITKDLEAMKAQGVEGATILNIGLFNERNFGVPPVEFGTAEWYNMFHWALQEADRLGMTIGAHNCDGWSTSGGPWITPEMSMKQIVWSKTVLPGGSSLDTTLLKPFGLRDFYQDVAVIAYKISENANSFQAASPTITVNDSIDGRKLYDGDPVSSIRIRKDANIRIDFRKPFTAEKLVIHPRVIFSWASMNEIGSRYVLYSSSDGKKLYPVKSFSVRGVNKNIEIIIPRITSKYFILEFQGRSNVPSYSALDIGEIELLKSNESPAYNPRITNHLEKIVNVKPDQEKDMFQPDRITDMPAVNISDIMDITGNMTADGHLKWNAPDGIWTVIRFGYTTTGSMNAPSTESGRGLECDKMDQAALDLHFRSFPKKLIENAGPMAGNTFKYLFIDSWECGYQNWTGKFPEEFKKRRGYSMLPWIPALCGEIIDDSRSTEAFLHDFRLTIADLIETNYYEHFADLCHKNGMELHAEVIYGGENYPPLKVYKSNRYEDLPMYEFWTSMDQNGFVDYHPSGKSEYVTPAQAGNLYGKTIIPSEAYTGYAYYSEAPWDLKPFGDRAYCEGINRMVLHSYVHQPFDSVPGMTLGTFANHFNRLNAWWPHVSSWFTYQARIQYLLQQGTTVSDILYFTGDRLPQYQPSTSLYDVPTGYNLQICNMDVLSNNAKVTDGSIELNNGQHFRILILPDDSVMNLSTLLAVSQLAHNGATILGPPPVGTLSMENMTDETSKLQDLAKEMWGAPDTNDHFDHKYGSGEVLWGESLKSLLQNLEYQPDFEWISPDSAKLLFIHKKINEQDIYFVANQEERSVDTECIFRIEGKTPECWDPQYGKVEKPAIFRIENGRTRIPVKFSPKESKLFVFNNRKPEQYITSVSSGGKLLFTDNPGGIIENNIPEILYSDTGYKILAENGGNYVVISNNGHEYNITAEPSEVYQVEDPDMELTFGDTGSAIKPGSSFKSWTTFNDPEEKYFSGRATYTIHFDLPKDWVEQTDSVYLSLGNVAVTAKVSMNGKALGTIWIPDYRINVTDIIRDSGNKLTVQVANVYRNRIIGDLRQYGHLKNAWTTSPIHNLFNPEMPLRQSGLLGPVHLIQTRSVLISRAD